MWSENYEYHYIEIHNVKLHNIIKLLLIKYVSTYIHIHTCLRETHKYTHTQWIWNLYIIHTHCYYYIIDTQTLTVDITPHRRNDNAVTKLSDTPPLRACCYKGMVHCICKHHQLAWPATTIPASTLELRRGRDKHLLGLGLTVLYSPMRITNIIACVYHVLTFTYKVNMASSLFT